LKIEVADPPYFNPDFYRGAFMATDANENLIVGSLVPIQKGPKLVEQEIFSEAAEKVRVFGIELLDIRFKRINIMKVCEQRSTIG
jgi:hypothetical protein